MDAAWFSFLLSLYNPGTTALAATPPPQQHELLCQWVAGNFEGPCSNVNKEGNRKDAKLRFEVKQTGCEQVVVKIVEEDFSSEETYEIGQGLKEKSNEDGYQILNGGTFGTNDSSFAGTQIHVNDLNQVDTVMIELTSKDGTSLDVVQTATGTRLTCPGLKRVNE